MYKFILTEDDKSYIKGLYNINEESDSFTLKQVQELLLQRGLDLGKTGVDGNYGPKTAAALVNALTSQTKISPMKPKEAKPIQTQTTQSTPQLQKPETEEDKQMERIALEKEKSTAKDLEQDLNQLKTAITNQPTKEQCTELIATAKVGIKKGVKLTDTSTLGQCFNSYNFIGGGSNKVKKHYGLKGRGN